MTTSKKLASTGLALTLGAGALASASFTGTAHAAVGNTAAVHGQTHNAIGQVWFDSGALPKPATNPGPTRDISLTAIANGSDIDVAITLNKGPNNSFNPLVGNPNVASGYSLDALVRLDGTPNTRGTERFQGPTGDDVEPYADVFPGGVTITGKIPRAGVGTHTVTLTDIVLNINGSAPTYSSGKELADQYAGFDTFYNPHPNSVTTPTDWALSETVVVSEAAPPDTVKPKIKINKPKKKKAKLGKSWTVVQGTITDDLSGPDKVSVKLTSKKGKKWSFFNGSKYKAAKNKKKAQKKAKALVAVPGLNGGWKVEPLIKAPKGTLFVTAVGSDKDGNTATVKVKQKIKK